jgi:hypothetical protein
MTQNSLLVVLNNLILDVLGIPIHLTLLFSFYLFTFWKISKMSSPFRVRNILFF